MRTSKEIPLISGWTCVARASDSREWITVSNIGRVKVWLLFSSPPQKGGILSKVWRKLAGDKLAFQYPCDAILAPNELWENNVYSKCEVWAYVEGVTAYGGVKVTEENSDVS